MARYTPDHKAATRRRLIEAAGRRFKSDGIDGSGIATLVADAGLTNGAFYNHFASKNDLVAAVVENEIAHQVRILDGLPPSVDSVLAFLRGYLGPDHRDNAGDGCPSAALLDEIARSDIAVREAYTTGAASMLRAVSRHLGATDPDHPDPRAVSVFALAVGAVQAARAVTDPVLSDRIRLAAFNTAATILTGAPHDPESPTDRNHS